MNSNLEDEDGNLIELSLNKGATVEDIREREATWNIELPFELKELLLFSNGIDLFGISIMPLKIMEYFKEEQLLTFHSWDDGDYDCISLNKNNEIIFVNHSPVNRYFVASSLYNWISEVFKEIETKGTLLHPFDYYIRQEDGLYKTIYNKINESR